MSKNELEDLRISTEKFYGIYRGVVEDNNPVNSSNEELQDGRIKVRIWGLHSKDKNKISTDSLPLAQPAYPVSPGSITGKGIWSVPVQGTHVFVFFENGDHMQPRYFATVPAIEPPNSERPDSNEGFADPDDLYPLSTLMGEPDMNRLMRNTEVENTAWEYLDNSPISVVCPGMEPMEWNVGDHSEVTYPDNFVIETKGRQTLEMNDQATLLYHNSDSYILLKNGTTYNHGGLKVDDAMDTMTLTVREGALVCNLTAVIKVLAPTIEATIVMITPKLMLAGSDLADVFNSHTHTGVQAGLDSSGIPNEQI